MIKSKIQQTIDYLSEPRKLIVVAVLVVVLIIVIYFISKKLKKVASGAGTTLYGDSKIESSTGTEITKSTDFTHLFARLWTAMAGIGTNEEEVYDCLRLLNSQADYMKLCNVWLSRWSGMGFMSKIHMKSTLPAQLQYDLTSSELQKCRLILEEKGIRPDF